MNFHKLLSTLDMDVVVEDASYLLQTYGASASEHVEHIIEGEVDDAELRDLGEHVVTTAFAMVVACRTACESNDAMTPLHFYAVFQTVAQMIDTQLTRTERGLN